MGSRKKYEPPVKVQKAILVVAVAMAVFSVWRLFDTMSWFRGDKSEQYSAKALGREELEQIDGFDSRAVVILGYVGKHQLGVTPQWPKVAFAVGDGTTLVTAAHCVDDFEDSRRTAVSAEMVLMSTYYGDVFDFEVIGIDEEADVAVLRANWSGHPALSLASNEEVAGARWMAICSRPCLPAEDMNRPFENDVCRVRGELLRVGKLRGEDAEPDKEVVLIGTKRVVNGWSGSPIVLPNNGKVTGVLGRLTSGRSSDSNEVQKYAMGCGVGAVWRLLEKHGVVLGQREEQWSPVEDADEGFSLGIEYMGSILKANFVEATAKIKRLAELRRESIEARILLGNSSFDAYVMRSAGKEYVDLAEVSFKEALNLDPDSGRAATGYGNLLMHLKRYDEALEQTEAALAVNPENELALSNRVLILGETDPNRAEEVVRELVEKNPENSHWWYWYYRALAKVDKDDEALTAAKKAVELNPDGLYAGGVADALCKLKQFDEAEPYYKTMTKKCRCQSCWYKYATFLISHRKDRMKDALEAITAAEKAKGRRISAENINYKKLTVLEKLLPDDAETLGQRLVKESQENGRYWWFLAGILRTQGKMKEAVSAAREAVRLSSDKNYEPRLADVLAKAGELEEAELTYQEMVEQYPQRQKYWFWYARFLCTYFPDRIAEANETLLKAETGTEKVWPVDPDELTKLREEIANKTMALQESVK